MGIKKIDYTSWVTVLGTILIPLFLAWLTWRGVRVQERQLELQMKPQATVSENATPPNVDANVVATKPWWPDMSPYWPYWPLGVMFLLVIVNAALVVRNRRPRDGSPSNSIRKRWLQWRGALVSDEEWLRKQLTDRTSEYETLDAELEKTKSELQKTRNERDGAMQAYKSCQHNFTMWRFTQFTQSYPGVKVKIRSAGYTSKDWPLVEQLKKLFGDTGWTVDVDPNNSPPLMPHPDYKVLLVVGRVGSPWQLQGFLDTGDGGLLPVKVGIKHDEIADDNKQITIEILPTVTT